MAPTVTGVPDFTAKKIRWYQHYDVDESARALANKLGGVQTNQANAFQIELVGTCDDKKKTSWDGKNAGVDYIYWPAAPDWALAEVAWLVRWLHDYHGVPLTCVKNWIAYGKDTRRPGITPASYGASPARMSFTQWQKFTGWCGHQHVPENDHGDPGSMNFARVIELAREAGANPPAPKPPAPVPARPKYEPFPGAAFFRSGQRSPIIAAMHKRLVAEGCNRYRSHANSDLWGSGDEASYASWQRKLGYRGSDADGTPGKTSWDKLKVPNV
ncbi:peptidoglycan-binding protein [Streptomyces formicae]|uniref:Peptidoglycan-binding protein n=2 Tax=Streptomyces formicae TaxID=1616117 RepID=A0ABY3X1L3_9ACTN|nr:peptidoglycan-binding protein [Streptomyces formicae]